MNILEVLSGGKFISTVCHAHSNAYNSHDPKT